MEYCPGSLAPRSPASNGCPARRGHGHRRAPRGRARIGAPGGAHPPRHAASNILITTFGSAVLADFGISSTLVRSDGDEVLAMSIPWSAPRWSPSRPAAPCRAGCGPRGHGVFAPWPGTARSSAASGAEHPRPLMRRRIARATFIRRSARDGGARRPAAGARGRDGPRARAPVPQRPSSARRCARCSVPGASSPRPARGARRGMDAGRGDGRFRRHHRARPGAQPGRTPKTVARRRGVRGRRMPRACAPRRKTRASPPRPGRRIACGRSRLAVVAGVVAVAAVAPIVVVLGSGLR